MARLLFVYLLLQAMLELLFLYKYMHLCYNFCKSDYKKWIFFAHRVCAFLLPNYPPKGLYQFIRIIEVYGEKILSSFLTFANAIGKIWFSFYFVIITKVNIPFVSSAAYLIIVYACFLLIVFYTGS